MPLQRLLLFLLGCIGTRSLFVYLSYRYTQFLPYMGYLALIPEVGFARIFAGGLRKTGIEVSGEKIRWNNLRPVHSALYGGFAYSAIHKNPNSWMILFLDTALGLGSFLAHHYG